MSRFPGKLEAVHRDLKLLKSLVFILGNEFIKTVLHIGQKTIAAFSKKIVGKFRILLAMKQTLLSFSYDCGTNVSLVI